METFIIPCPSANGTSGGARCSSDHVMFNDNYEGYSLIYNCDEKYYKIFLENGHRSKYGLI